MRLLLVTRDFPLHASEAPGWSYELGRRFASRRQDAALIGLAGVLSLRLGALCRARAFDGDTKRFIPGTSPQLARELGLSGRRVPRSERPGRAAHRSNDAILN